jgi:hypothetical protein
MSYKMYIDQDIIDAMADMKDMYRMVSFIDSEKYKTSGGISAPHLAMDDCAKQYAAKRHGFFRRKVSEHRALRIIHNTVAAGYIEVIGDNTPAHNGHKMRVCTGDGMQLISKEWGFVRRGLAEQTMKRYPETKSKYLTKYTTRAAFMGALITAALAAGAAIVAAYVGE